MIVAFDPRLIVRPPFLIKRLIPMHPGLPPINVMKLRRSQIRNRTRMDLNLEERGWRLSILGARVFSCCNGILQVGQSADMSLETAYE